MYLPDEKITKLIKPVREIFEKENLSLRVLTSLVGKLISTYQAVLPVPIQYQSLQMQQILNLKGNFSYEDRVEPNPAALE